MFPYKAGKCGRRQNYTAGICVCTMYTVHAEGLNLADDNVPRNFLLWNEKSATFILILQSKDTEL